MNISIWILLGSSVVAFSKEGYLKPLAMFPVGTSLQRVILTSSKSNLGEVPVIRAEEFIIEDGNSVLGIDVAWQSSRLDHSTSTLKMKEGHVSEIEGVLCLNGKIIFECANLSVFASGANLNDVGKTIALQSPCRVVFAVPTLPTDNHSLRRLETFRNRSKLSFVDLKYAFPFADRIDQYYLLLQPAESSCFHSDIIVSTLSEIIVDKIRKTVISNGPSVIKEASASIFCRGGLVFRFDHDDDQMSPTNKKSAFSKLRSIRGIGGTMAEIIDKKQETSILRSREVLFTAINQTARFSGDVPSIHSEKGILKGTQPSQFFTINSKKNLIVGPGIWRCDQDIEGFPAH